jgi:polysaccharide biosynthesis protein PslG
MIRSRLTIKTAWPFLLIILVMVAGATLAACGPAAPAATPTPTKTPRPAAAEATATSEPTQAPTQVPATVTTPSQPTAAPTAAPSAAATAGPKPTEGKPSPTAPSTAPTPARVDGSMGSPDYGVQDFLWWQPEVADRDLQLTKDAGFTWVKQLVSWQDVEGAGKGQYDWTNLDRIVGQAEHHGLKLIVRVSQDPDRPFWAGNAPQNAGDFANFLAAMASRYKGRIQAYQVWNEPNLAREWGGRRPDPAGYTGLLKKAYSAIKGADPKATVITAGMAPTGTDTEIAMPDIKFYDQMYQAMKGNSDGYFDMLGVHAAGFAAPPEVSPDQTAADKPKYGGERFFAFRHVEDIRKIMEKYGDKDKRVAVLEFGWTTDNRPDSPYYWHGAGAGIDELKQGCYLLGALKWAKDNWQPWIGLMSMIYMPDVKWTKNDEQYYWSIIGPGYPDLYLRAPYVIVQNYLTKGIVDDNCPQYK